MNIIQTAVKVQATPEQTYKHDTPDYDIGNNKFKNIFKESLKPVKKQEDETKKKIQHRKEHSDDTEVSKSVSSTDDNSNKTIKKTKHINGGKLEKGKSVSKHELSRKLKEGRIKKGNIKEEKQIHYKNIHPEANHSSEDKKAGVLLDLKNINQKPILKKAEYTEGIHNTTSDKNTDIKEDLLKLANKVKGTDGLYYLKDTKTRKKDESDKNNNNDSQKHDLQKTGKITLVDVRSRKSSEKAFTLPVDTAGHLTEENTVDKNVKILQVDTLATKFENLSEYKSIFRNPVKSALFQQLKENINSKIVKQTGIFLKDGNNGEIKLVLKPENLGKVRIRIILQNDHIAGKIIVENSIVKEIFEKNLEQLYKEFENSGFLPGKLNVSVSGKESRKENSKQDSFIDRGLIKALEEHIPLIGEIGIESNLVNLIA